MSAAPLVHNALAGRRRPLGTEAFLQLWSTAVQPGGLDDGARAAIAALRLQPEAAELRAALLAAATPEAAPNPEITAAREADPHFDRRVEAVRSLARPGDLLFWGSRETRFPWGLMKIAYGPWMHVSLVLSDGRLLDPYWPEGTTVSTLEAAIAKSHRRIRATELMLARPERPLSPEALASVTEAAIAQVGRPYGLLSILGVPSASASCARSVWEHFQAHGIDLEWPEGRLYHYSVTPCDVIQPGYALIRPDGRVETTGFPEARPANWILRIAQAGDWLASRFPRFDRQWLSVGKPLTWLFMVTMLPRPILSPTATVGRVGRYLRPGN